jgi:nucleoid-associated protein YgaU
MISPGRVRPQEGATLRVFLSHRAESEGPLARRLSVDLDRQGIPTWVAPRDIDPGITWPQAIEAGLRACSHVAVLLSAQAMGSRAVQQELQIAEMLQLDGRVVLVTLLVERVELPLWLRVTQGADFTGTYDDGLAALVRSVRQTAPVVTDGQVGPGERVVVHRVRRGDRVDLLAAQYLGEPARWRQIAEDNPGLDVSELEPGTLVSIRTTRGR